MVKNENGDDFNGVMVKLKDGTEIGKIESIKHVDRINSLQKMFELSYNPSARNLDRKKGEAGKILDTSLERDFFEKIFKSVSDTDLPEQKEENIYEKIQVPEGLDNPEFGRPLVSRLLKDLMYLDILDKARAQYFLDKNSHLLEETERKIFMEKYGVKIDPKKVADAKKSSKEKTASGKDPNVNVPKDPELGTEPYEKDPENGQS